jgi:hypothetical protein
VLSLPEIHVLQLQACQHPCKNGSKSMLAFNTEADTSCRPAAKQWRSNECSNLWWK